MDNGGMPDNWVAPEPAAVGSKAWLDDMAFAFMVERFDGLPDRSGVFELPKVLAGGKEYELGYFVLFKQSFGKNYFRVEFIEPVNVRPKFSCEVIDE